MVDRIPKLNKKNNKVQLDLSNINDFASLKTANDAGTLRGDILANNDGTGTDVIGTPLNKGTLLSDTTCDVLGIPHTAVLNDAILGLAIGAGKYGFKIHLQTPGGNPIGSCLISGVTRPNGTAAYTDGNGDVLVVSTSTNPNVNVSTWFMDCPSSSFTLQSTGVLTAVTLTMTRNSTTNWSTSSSATLHFSNDVKTINYTIVGGGGGGSGTNAYQNDDNYNVYVTGGGGGSGYIVSGSFTMNANYGIAITVGAGGAGGEQKLYVFQNIVSGGTGGSTQISLTNGDVINTALGGGGGYYGLQSGGGQGGSGQVAGSPGSAGGAGGVNGNGYGSGGNAGIPTGQYPMEGSNGNAGSAGICWLNWTF